MSVMEALTVELVDPRESDWFAPRYDGDSDALVLETESIRHWPYGATLDGILTLDLNEDRILVHAELLLPRNTWRSAALELPHPDKTPRALRLPSLHTQTVDDSLEVGASLVESLLVLRWAEVAFARRVPIGKGVTALVVSDRLAGLTVETAGM